LESKGLLDNWRKAVAAAVHRLEQETLEEDQYSDLQRVVQEAAALFQQHWPAPEGPTHFLRLESISYPAILPPVALGLVTGIPPVETEQLLSGGKNGVTLLLAP
jgi:hypothetical protein